MKMLEHKGLGFEPIYERSSLTDDLHETFKFNTDYEILSYKKIKNIIASKFKVKHTQFFGKTKSP
jgi:ligand-binding SRPBCC domain-containing protein